MVRVAAVVLCGGESRRMGTPKADLPFGTETLLQRSVRLLSAVARPVIVAAAHGQALPTLPSEVIVVHDPPVRRGPMQGLATALAALAPSVDLVYVAPVDSPFFDPRWLEALVAAIGDHDAVILKIGGRVDPLNALYRTGPTRSAVGELLGRGELRASALPTSLNCRTIDKAEWIRLDPDDKALVNLNTPEDYRRALERFTRRDLEGPS